MSTTKPAPAQGWACGSCSSTPSRAGVHTDTDFARRRIMSRLWGQAAQRALSGAGGAAAANSGDGGPPLLSVTPRTSCMGPGSPAATPGGGSGGGGGGGGDLMFIKVLGYDMDRWAGSHVMFAFRGWVAAGSRRGAVFATGPASSAGVAGK